MNNDSSLNYDAEALRSQLIASNITAKLTTDFSISRAKPGIYHTQRGSFEITSEQFILCVCVWEGGVVEISTESADGTGTQIDTLRDSTIEIVVEKISEHLDKYV